MPVASSDEALLDISSAELFGEAMIYELDVNHLVRNTTLEKLVDDGSTLKDISLDESSEQLFRHLSDLTSVLLISSGRRIRFVASFCDEARQSSVFKFKTK